MLAMADFRFEWDDPKNNENFWEHGVWFEEAAAVFFDLRATLLDGEHSTALATASGTRRFRSRRARSARP